MSCITALSTLHAQDAYNDAQSPRLRRGDYHRLLFAAKESADSIAGLTGSVGTGTAFNTGCYCPYGGAAGGRGGNRT